MQRYVSLDIQERKRIIDEFITRPMASLKDKENMEIKTKFNVRDHVCGITYQHKLTEFVVAKISVSVKAYGVEIDYYPSDSFAEKYCFSTKGEAFAYIQSELIAITFNHLSCPH